MDEKPLAIGIAGLGTVGAAVVELLNANREAIAQRAGRKIAVAAVSARDRNKDRGIAMEGMAWEDDPVALARREDVSVFVELMGGTEGAAMASVEAALSAGKDVVTANKAMLAVHGGKLAAEAEEKGAVLRFEAAVAGGIPIVKVMTESLAGDRVTRILGVMNGTCNYILTRMEATGKPYEEIFAEADSLGYLEADPELDVGGIDAGHKLALLSSIAFGTQVDFAGMHIEGIARISIRDIEHAGDMGYRIKLLCVSRMSERGLEQSTQPCLVPASSPLGQIENATNMVVAEGDAAGPIFLRGAGAGGGPTAASVIADIMDIARGRRVSTFGQPARSLKSVPSVKAASPVPHYVRLLLKDRPGVLAEIAAAFGEAEVSIDRMRQIRHDGKAAPVLIVTHPASRPDLDAALGQIGKSSGSLTEPVALRIEEV